MRVVPPAVSSRPRTHLPWQVAAGGGAAAALDAAFDPSRRHVPLCPFRAITGWDCPFCGSLRAVSAALRGHPAAAWHDNPLLWLALPVLIWGWARWARTGSGPRLSRAGAVLVVALGVAFTVVRNLPFAAALRPA